jgi:hypothetical protein
MGRLAGREDYLYLNQERSLAMPVETVALRKESLYFELLPQRKAVPEVLEHIQAKHGQIPFAVVSGSLLDSVTTSLTALTFSTGSTPWFVPAITGKASQTLKVSCWPRRRVWEFLPSPAWCSKTPIWASKPPPQREWPRSVELVLFSER